MKSEVLLELAARWERDAAEPMVTCAQTDMDTGKERGQREAKRECADALRSLVSLLG